MHILPEQVPSFTSTASMPRGTSGRTARTIAVDAARSAGRLAVSRLAAELDVHYKGRADLVTDVDVRAQDLIVEAIAKEFPAHAFLAEEGDTEERPSDFVWVVDPIDGTLNFASDIGFFCVSIALTKDGSPILGVVHDPVRRETFVARRGAGCRLNGRPVAVSVGLRLDRATVGFDMGYDEDGRRQALEDAVALRPKIQTFRILGSAALGLAYVACGRLDVYFHNWLFPWDLAAACLLVQEAGGRITDRQGRPCTLGSRSVVAANQGLHSSLMHNLPGSDGGNR